MKIGRMNLWKKDGVEYLTFPELERFPGLVHSFSTRIGGVSPGAYASMNLNFRRGDSDENVLENYRCFCRAAGFDFDGLVASAQDHHTFLRRVGEAERGVGFTRPRDMESVDGLCTDVPGVALVTSYADCVPLYFFDPRRRAIALAHAGWRGTVARIGEKMVRKMQSEFGSDPASLIAAVGPSIGPCCYEVDAPVRDRVLALSDIRPAEVMTDLHNGKYMLNLWECNRRILAAAGVRNLSVGEVCTKCHPELFFSHRAMGQARGGMVAMMELKKG